MADIEAFVREVEIAAIQNEGWAACSSEGWRDTQPLFRQRAAMLRSLITFLRSVPTAGAPEVDDIAELRAMADKFERETQVFLGYRNVDRAALLRRAADELSRLRTFLAEAAPRQGEADHG